ncbi:MAG TPA: CPBP family intramembrane glutamic endopeptidase, partial [Micromonosporaceae bacterium]
RRLTAARGTDPQALLHFYHRNIARKWLLLIPVVLIMTIPPRVGPHSLGIAWPHGETYLAWQFFIEITVVIAATSLLYRRMSRRGEHIPGLRAFQMLIPQSRTERQWAYAVAATAGITEEVLFRGLILNAGIWAGLPIVAALLVSSVLFGATHIYQGTMGVILTTAFGLLLGWFYLATLSLLMPVVLHILLDLRGLVWIRPAPSEAPPAHALSVPPDAPTPQASAEDAHPRPLVRKPFPTE